MHDRQSTDGKKTCKEGCRIKDLLSTTSCFRLFIAQQYRRIKSVFASNVEVKGGWDGAKASKIIYPHFLLEIYRTVLYRRIKRVVPSSVEGWIKWGEGHRRVIHTCCTVSVLYRRIKRFPWMWNSQGKWDFSSGFSQEWIIEQNKKRRMTMKICRWWVCNRCPFAITSVTIDSVHLCHNMNDPCCAVSRLQHLVPNRSESILVV